MLICLSTSPLPDLTTPDITHLIDEKFASFWGRGGGYLDQFSLSMCCWPLRTPTAEFIVNCQFANEVSLGKCNLFCHFLFKCIYLIKPSRSVMLKNEFTHFFFFQIPKFFQKNFQKFSYPQNPENSSNFYENVRKSSC